MKLKLVWLVGTGTIRCRVFMGPTRELLALNGELALTPSEAVELRVALRGGGWRRGERAIDGVFEVGWPEELDDVDVDVERFPGGDPVLGWGE